MHHRLDEFIAARNERVRSLRADGENDLAKQVAALRRPSIVVWALNQACTAATSEIAQLRTAGERMRTAQEALVAGEPSAPGELESASRELRRRVDAAVRPIAAALQAAGHSASDDAIRRIGDALRVLAAAPAEEYAALREGRLREEPVTPGFPVLEVSAAPRRPPVEDVEAAARRKRIDAATADVRRAEEIERAAREQLEAARVRHEEAAGTLQDARARLEELQRRHTDPEL